MQPTTPEPYARKGWWLRLCPVLGLIAVFAACEEKASNPNVSRADAAGLDAGDAAPFKDAAGDGAAGSATACAPAGGFRCKPEQPAVLEVCDPDTVLGWTEYLRCGSPDLCDAASGQCLACEPGEFRCDGWRLQRCDESGSHWRLQTECVTEDHCDSREARCLTCLSGQGFCSEETLVSCNVNQDGFQATECESADLCNVASMGCRPCFPGEYQCAGLELMRCDDEHSWQPQDVCDTEFLCAKTLETLIDNPSAAPECQAPTCAAGEFRCNPDNPIVLEGCPPSRDRFEVIEVCGQAAQCNADEGKCDSGCGVPGAFRCNGAALQRCDAEGVEWLTEQVCNNDVECNAQQRDCVACEVGDWQCNDNLLQRCDDDLHWVTEEACASARLCQIDVDSALQACLVGCGTPESFRCNGRQLEECGPDASAWEVRERCASEALCNPTDGRCTPAVCPSAGLLTCQGQELRRCREDLTGWDIVTTCAPETLCDIGSMGCVDSCPSPDYRCNGAQPEQCTAGPDGATWAASQAPCAAFGLCVVDDDGARCQEPVCGGSLADYRCEGSDAQACNEARTGFELALSCPANTTCDVGSGGDGPPQCDVCAAGQFSCAANGNLQRCSTDGQTLTTVQPCRDQDHCSIENGGQVGFCYVCDAGDTRCNAGNLERCSEDRRTWELAQTCDPSNGCHDSPGYADYCNACPIPGQRSCDGANGLRTCSDDQRSWTASTSCEYGCQDSAASASSDYCRDCSPNTAQCSTTDDDARRVCSSLGRWGNYVDCPGEGACIDSGTADYCGTCVPDTYTCVGSGERRRCSSDGQPGGVTACPQPTPVCLDGDCVECAPGAAATCPGGTGSQDRRTCSDEGQWETNVCEFPLAVCHQSECVACVPGEARCMGGSPERREVCGANGTWGTSHCIASGEGVCMDGECVQCDPDVAQARCDDLSTREYCAADGDWETQACTGNTPVCVAGTCVACDPQTQPARCTPDGDADERQVCRSGSWVDESCGGATPVCSGDGQCVCSNGSYRCGTSGARQRCSGQVWIDDPCGDGYCTGNGSCVECVGDASCPAHLPECVSGQCECENDAERCSNGAHQVCDDGAWLAQPCAGNTPVCDAPSGRCVCEDGAVQCAQGMRQTCEDGAWTSDASDPACTSCNDAQDCSGATPICDGALCVACSTGDCPDGLACASTGACVECTSSDLRSCTASNPVCSPENECVECTPTSDGLCSGVTPVCDDYECRGCDTISECPTGSVCSESGACLECTPDDASACPTATPACSTDNECVECTATDVSACPAAEPVCDPQTNTCVQCVDSADCPDALPACDVELGLCVGCQSDADCDGSYCDLAAGVCVACLDSGDCPTATPICEPQENACVQCLLNADCDDPATPICNPTSNLCGPCVNGELCPNGQVCVALECTPCAPDSDAAASVLCPSGLTCNAEGACEE